MSLRRERENRSSETLYIKISACELRRERSLSLPKERRKRRVGGMLEWCRNFKESDGFSADSPESSTEIQLLCVLCVFTLKIRIFSEPVTSRRLFARKENYSVAQLCRRLADVISGRRCPGGTRSFKHSERHSKEDSTRIHVICSPFFWKASLDATWSLH